MSEPFLAEVRIFGFNFSPRGWALCDGQILPINQNQSLYSLLGNTYGGDGRTSFALPDLRGRTPLHAGDGITLGQRGGEETHALTPGEIPQHTHVPVKGVTISTAASTTQNGNLLANTDVGGGRGGSSITPYAAPNNLVSLHPSSVANTGAGQGHNNMQPYLVVNYCIALQGLFPSRN
ncbi:MAG: phage tail protein [Chromatiaceae bacterium]|nr:phage tail protein [Chromatiaceae bacterium]